MSDPELSPSPDPEFDDAPEISSITLKLLPINKGNDMNVNANFDGNFPTNMGTCLAKLV